MTIWNVTVRICISPQYEFTSWQRIQNESIFHTDSDKEKRVRFAEGHACSPATASASASPPWGGHTTVWLCIPVPPPPFLLCFYAEKVFFFYSCLPKFNQKSPTLKLKWSPLVHTSFLPSKAPPSCCDLNMRAPWRKEGIWHTPSG